MKKKYQKLSAKWSKKENDLLHSFPSKADGHLLYGFFAGYVKCNEFKKELEQRGYDINTLRFEVKLTSEEVIAKDKRRLQTWLNQDLSWAESDLIENVIDYRIVSVDGVGRVLTSDVRPNRANLIVNNGKITEITFG